MKNYCCNPLTVLMTATYKPSLVTPLTFYELSTKAKPTEKLGMDFDTKKLTPQQLLLFDQRVPPTYRAKLRGIIRTLITIIERLALQILPEHVLQKIPSSVQRWDLLVYCLEDYGPLANLGLSYFQHDKPKKRQSTAFSGSLEKLAIIRNFVLMSKQDRDGKSPHIKYLDLFEGMNHLRVISRLIRIYLDIYAIDTFNVLQKMYYLVLINIKRLCEANEHYSPTKECRFQ